MKEWKVSGKLASGARFTVFAKAFDTWHAQAIARKMYSERIVAMSAFKVMESK